MGLTTYEYEFHISIIYNHSLKLMSDEELLVKILFSLLPSNLFLIFFLENVYDV